MKTIKSLFFVMLGMLLFSSCEKNPDLDQLDGNDLVRTSYDTKANFGNYKNYYINDTVYAYIPGSGSTLNLQKWIYGNDSKAKSLLDKVKSNMDSRQYTGGIGKDYKSNTDLALRVAYIQDVNYFMTYVYPYYSYWWYYWWWGYYYPYPFPVVYSYETNSIVIDMIDAKNVTDKGYTAVWNAYGTGIATGDNQYDGSKALGAIDQAFSQSPYLKSNK